MTRVIFFFLLTFFSPYSLSKSEYSFPFPCIILQRTLHLKVSCLRWSFALLPARPIVFMCSVQFLHFALLNFSEFDVYENFISLKHLFKEISDVFGLWECVYIWSIWKMRTLLFNSQRKYCLFQLLTLFKPRSQLSSSIVTTTLLSLPTCDHWWFAVEPVNSNIPVRSYWPAIKNPVSYCTQVNTSLVNMQTIWLLMIFLGRSVDFCNI